MDLKCGQLACTFAALGVLAALGGCSGATNSPAAGTSATTSTADAALADAAKPATEATASTDGVLESPVTEKPATEPPPASPERFVMLTGGGPVIVHARAYLDGQPQRDLASAALEDVLKTAAGDREVANLTWVELIESPAITSGQLGNSPLADAAARYRAARDYDSNRDQRVQRNELAALLSGDMSAGQSAGVQWVADRMAGEKWNSPLFVLLDTDQDGRLSREECAAAPIRLRSRDVDDNDAVTIADFRPPEMPRQMSTYRPQPRPTRGFALEAHSLDSIYYTLCELFNADQGLTVKQFENCPELFRKLDADENERISQREIAGLIDAPADLVVRVDFFADAPPRLSLVSVSDQLVAAGARAETSADRLVVEGPAVRLHLYVVDAARPADRSDQAQQRFAALDTNDDQLLDAEELAKAELPADFDLQELDADGDGKLTLDEVRSAIVAKPIYRDLRLHIRLAEESDPLLGWLDSRPDGRLTSRELSGAAARLAELDTNGDGLIAIAEIPDRLLCVVQRGGDSRLPAGGMLPVPTSRQSRRQEMPPWLSAMDQNADGEISRREFLGTEEQFHQLDANADGFIDLGEVVSAQPPGDGSPATNDAAAASE